MKTKLLFMLLLCSFYCVSCSDDVKTDVKEKTEVEVNYVKLNEALNLYSQDLLRLMLRPQVQEDFGSGSELCWLVMLRVHY